MLLAFCLEAVKSLVWLEEADLALQNGRFVYRLVTFYDFVQLIRLFEAGDCAV
jgi:hypothetical protein